jgi:hypothetical protein
MIPFLFICGYLIGIGVAWTVIDHRGYDGGHFDLDENADVIYMMVLSVLWPALLVFTTARWLVGMGIGR